MKITLRESILIKRRGTIHVHIPSYLFNVNVQKRLIKRFWANLSKSKTMNRYKNHRIAWHWITLLKTKSQNDLCSSSARWPYNSHSHLFMNCSIGFHSHAIQNLRRTNNLSVITDIDYFGAPFEYHHCLHRQESRQWMLLELSNHLSGKWNQQLSYSPRFPLSFQCSTVVLGAMLPPPMLL